MFCLSACGWAFGGLAAEPLGASPLHLDLGEVRVWEYALASVPIRNPGANPLKVNGPMTPMGNAVPITWTPVVAPGGVGTVDMGFLPPADPRGRVEERVVVAVAGGELRAFTVTMRFVPFVQALTPDLQVSDLQVGTKTKATVALTWPKTIHPIKFKTGATPPGIAVAFATQGPSSAIAEITLDPAKLDPASANRPLPIQILTDVPSCPVVPLTVTWKAEARFTLNASEVVLAVGPQGAPVQSITVQDRRGRAFRIVDLDIDTPSVTVNTSFTLSSASHQVDLQTRVRPTDGPVKGRLTIYTDDPLCPCLSLPVSIAILPEPGV
jgi:hypothetical protein